MASNANSDQGSMDRLLATCVDRQTLTMVMQRTIKELEKRFLDTKGPKEELIERLVRDNERKLRDEEEFQMEEEEIENENEILTAPPEAPQIPQPVPGQPTDVYLAQLMGTLGIITQQNQRILLSIHKQQTDNCRDALRQTNVRTNVADIQVHTTPDLYTSIPAFHGRRTDSPHEWLEILQRAARQQNWRPETKMSTATSLLKSEAKDWQDTCGYKVKDWDNWVDLFTNHFSRPVTLREWTAKVEERVQAKGETLSSYMHSKLKLISRSPIDIPEKEKIDYLISGIKDRVTAHVIKLQQLPDIFELLGAAREIDEQNDLCKATTESKSDRRVGDESHRKSEEQHSRQIATFGEHQKEKQLRRYEPKSDKPPRVLYRRGMDKSLMVCFNCNERGHLAFECNRQDKRVHRENRNRDEPPRRVNCVLRSREKGLPVVEGKINGKTFPTLLDSGSEVSLVDKELVPSSAKIRSWDGDTELQILGSTYKPLGIVYQTVTVGNTEESIPLCVTDDPPYPILLGSNWRQAANVSITVYPNSDVKIEKMNNEHTDEEEKNKRKPLLTGSIIRIKYPNTPIFCGVNISSELDRMIVRKISECSVDVSRSDLKDLENVLRENAEAFSDSDRLIGCHPEVEHAIILKDELPVKSRPNRYSWHDRKFINETIDDWKAKDIIEDSVSEFASPVVLVDQLFHTPTPRRLCIDYRKLNDKTEKVRYPMPVIDDVIERVVSEDSLYFNTMDIKMAFMTVKVREEDKPKTAIITQDGLYQFKRMPFELSNAPATMQSLVNRAYKEVPRTATYLDDIGQGAQSAKQAINLLECVLKKTIDNGLIISLEKCQFLQKSVKFLGQIISKEGRSPDPERLNAVYKYNEFETRKQLRSFIQFASYFRKYIRNFAKIARPLNSLLKKDAEHEWNETHDLAVSELKSRLLNPPILSHFKQNAQRQFTWTLLTWDWEQCCARFKMGKK